MRFCIGLIFALSILSTSVFAETRIYNMDPLHTSVTWHVSHFGFSNPSGKWMVESGVIMLDENNMSKSKVNATIEISDLDSGIQKLDEHLLSSQFLDASQFPYATFISTNIKQMSKHKLIVNGLLTLHGVTKPVTLNVTFNQLTLHPINLHKTAGFSATGHIKRSDFGIKAYLPGLGDDLTLSIETEAILASESSAK